MVSGMNRSNRLILLLLLCRQECQALVLKEKMQIKASVKEGSSLISLSTDTARKSLGGDWF